MNEDNFLCLVRQLEGAVRVAVGNHCDCCLTATLRGHTASNSETHVTTPPRPHPQTTMSSVIMIFHYGNRHMPVWQMSPTLVSVLVCFLRVTGLSYSCVAHIQSVPLAQGTGRQHLQAARGCNVCGGGHRLWSTDPDTNPRMTKETLHSPVVSLKRGKRVVRDIQYVKVKKNRICGNKGSFRAHLLSCDTN